MCRNLPSIAIYRAGDFCTAICLLPQLVACRNLPAAGIFHAATCRCRNFPVTAFISYSFIFSKKTSARTTTASNGLNGNLQLSSALLRAGRARDPPDGSASTRHGKKTTLYSVLML